MLPPLPSREPLTGYGRAVAPARRPSQRLRDALPGRADGAATWRQPRPDPTEVTEARTEGGGRTRSRSRQASDGSSGGSVAGGDSRRYPSRSRRPPGVWYTAAAEAAAPASASISSRAAPPLALPPAPPASLPAPDVVMSEGGSRIVWGAGVGTTRRNPFFTPAASPSQGGGQWGQRP